MGRSSTYVAGEGQKVRGYLPTWPGDGSGQFTNNLWQTNSCENTTSSRTWSVMNLTNDLDV